MSEKYLIDSNSLIAASQRAYDFDCFPSFWKWLQQEIQTRDSRVIVPHCVFEEIKEHNDQLSSWSNLQIKSFIYDERNQATVWTNYAKVMAYINNSGIYIGAGAENWSQAGKADLLLIAIGMTTGCQVVTFEQRSGAFESIISTDGIVSNQLQNPSYQTSKEPKIPDVADHFGVECIDFYSVERDLGLVI